MRARAFLPTAVAAAMLVVGCTSPGVEPPGLTASPTATPAPSPPPEPPATPTDGIQVHSDPAAGIIFEDVPDLTGDEAEVYNWIAVYHQAYWETMTTNTASETVRSIASTSVMDRLVQIASQNTEIGARIGGTFHARISDISVEGDTATGHSCSDHRDVEFVADSGTYSPEEAGFGRPGRLDFTMLRLADSDVWYIQAVDEVGTC